MIFPLYVPVLGEMRLCEAQQWAFDDDDDDDLGTVESIPKHIYPPVIVTSKDAPS